MTLDASTTGLSHQALARPIRAVFLDVDGVLLDSLPQHLRICQDIAARQGTAGPSIPDIGAFRRMVARGVKVSPMLDFFLAVGFEPDVAERAVVEYQRDFMRRYRPVPFPGFAKMLDRLHHSSLQLGLVTANTRANVEPALGSAMRYFDPRCLFYFDSYPQPRGKDWCLTEGARILGLRPERCVFVGDQPADAVAAEAAGFYFLGVSFGWGLTPDETRWPMAHHVDEIADALIGPAGDSPTAA